MISCRDVAYSVGNFRLDLSLEVAEGEYFVLLGHTGSGKSVSLECLAGLRRVESGQIAIGGRDVTRAEPRARSVGYVPQEGALFRHLSVADNIAFALRVRGVAPEVRASEAGRLAGMLGIAGLIGRPVAGLSGGEKQRVALARALAAKPGALLLDEPVSALDGDTRDGILAELRRVQRETGTTTVHVCHDLDEMRRVADRVGVLLNGRLLQVGAPEEIRARPSCAHVARALDLGTVLRGTAEADGAGGCVIRAGDLTVRSPARAEGEVEFLVRSGAIQLGAPASAPPGEIPLGRVDLVVWQEAAATVELSLGATRLKAEVARSTAEELSVREGGELAVAIPPDAVVVFDLGGA